MQNTIEVNEALEALKNHTSIILDVRSASEYAGGHIAGSKNIDFYDLRFKDKINTLNKDASYIIVCLSGGRSGDAVALMQSLGFKDVKNLLGGISAWRASGPLIVSV